MGSKRTLLIVEDEPAMRLAIKSALSALEDHNIVEAADGLEALRIIDEVNPDLIVLDLLMPKMGGIDVLIALQERDEPRPDRKIIVLSALVAPQMVEHLQRLGAHRVVTKPFHIHELLNTVEEVCAGTSGTSLSSARPHLNPSIPQYTSVNHRAGVSGTPG